MAALKTMKTASRPLKCGREADGMPERGRPAREADEKLKTSEKANVFRNLTHPLRSSLGGCGILPRSCGWWAGGNRNGTVGMTALACPVTPLAQRRGKMPHPRK
jgi:hypothetical protein